MLRALHLLLALFTLLVLHANTRANEEPLPQGAKLRLGPTQFRLTKADWQGSLISPWRGSVISPDGRGLLFPRNGIGFEFLDFTSGKVTKTFKVAGPENLITYYPLISADGKRLLATGFPPRVWELETGKVLLTFQPKNIDEATMSADGKTVATSGLKGVTIWNVDTGKEGKTLPIKLTGLGMRLSPDGQTLVTSEIVSNADKQETAARLWDAATGKELATLKPPKPFKFAKRYFFSPDSKTLAVSHDRDETVLFDARTGKVEKTLTFDAEFIQHTTFTPDSKGLLGIHRDHTVQWITIEDGKTQSTTKCPLIAGSVEAIAFPANDKAVIWGYHGAAGFAWEVPSGKSLTPAEGHFDRVTGVAFSPDGKEIITIGGDHRTLRWDAATGKQLGVVKLNFGRVERHFVPLALSGDSKRLFTTGAVYDLQTGKGVAQSPQIEVSVFPNYAAVSNDGSFGAVVWPVSLTTCSLVVGDSSGKVKLDVSLPGPAEGWGTGIAITPDGSRVIAASMPLDDSKGRRETVIRVWTVTDAKKVCEETVPDVRGEGRSIAISSDGKTAFLTSLRGPAFAFDLEKGKPGRTYGEATVNSTDAPLLSPDGKLLAVSEVTNKPKGGQVHALRVYDVATGEVRNTFEVPYHPAAFSPDGKTLATYADCTVLLWNVNEKK